MYWHGETDAQCSPFRDAASSLLASGEGWKRELIGSSTPTSTLDASHSRLAGSYCPISLLSCVDKLLERMVNRRLINHLESNNVLSPTQTGYRKYRSTEDQFVYLAQNIEDAFQEKRKVLAVFFDLSNAFEKVWKVSFSPGKRDFL